MTLSNSQYDSIQREYDAIQLKNRRIRDKRREEIYKLLPAYAEAAGEVSSSPFPSAKGCWRRSRVPHRRITRHLPHFPAKKQSCFWRRAIPTTTWT